MPIFDAQKRDLITLCIDDSQAGERASSNTCGVSHRKLKRSPLARAREGCAIIGWEASGRMRPTPHSTRLGCCAKVLKHCARSCCAAITCLNICPCWPCWPFGVPFYVSLSSSAQLFSASGLDTLLIRRVAISLSRTRRLQWVSLLRHHGSARDVNGGRRKENGEREVPSVAPRLLVLFTVHGVLTPYSQ